MKRILFMHQTSTIGGGSYCLLSIVKELNKSDWEPIVALRTPGPLADELHKVGAKVIYFPQMKGIPYNHSLNWKNILAYRQVILSGKSLRELLLREKIDVLYLNNMMLAPYLRPAKRVGCKTVLHVREHWPLNEHKKQLEWVRKIVYANCDKMIAINHYSASIFPKMKATIVYDWIDMDSRYSPIPMSTFFKEDLDGKKVFLFTGGMAGIKGGLQVASTFINKLTDRNNRLLMLGVDTDIQYNGVKGAIRKILACFGIEMQSDKLRRLVKTDNRIACSPAIYDLTHIIQQSYCMLSYFTIPHANLGLAECLIVGTPAIGANTEEAQEYSLGAIPELLFPINNVSGFEKAIENLNSNYKEIKGKIDCISDNITKMFNKERNLKVLRGVFEEILK